MSLLILYLAIALGFSFLCSIAEAVMLTVSPSYIASLEEKRPRAAARLQTLKQEIDRPLAAILSLNTIAHTVGAAGVGAQATMVFGSRYVGVVSAVLTLLILVFSEIIPKTLGAVYWRGLAPPVARVVQVLIWAMYPFVLLSEVITRVLSPGGAPDVVTREELAALAELGVRQGHLEAKESLILQNLLRLRSLTVSDIMTPRTVVLALPASATIGEVFQSHPELSFSRIPIYREGRDDMIGFVLKSDILLAQARDEHDRRLADLNRRELKTLSADASLSDAFDVLLAPGGHIALVLDDYGVQGIVTQEDLVETLLGMEIVDEADTAVDMRALARAKWEQRARRFGTDPTE